MQDKRYYFTLQQKESISKLISSEKIRNVYDKLSILIMDENNNNNIGFFKDYNEHYLIKFMIASRFVTYNIISLQNSNTSESSSVNNNSTELIDATFCFNHECYIFKQVDNSLVTRILNKLKENNVYLINTNMNLITYNENFSDEHKEIFNFCSYFKNEILENQFVQSTIAPIVAYLIRRYFCPTNYFTYLSFFSFNKRKEKSTNLYNRIVRFLFTYKEKDFFLTDRVNILIEKIKENSDESYQIQEFKKSDFITLRTINSNNNFVFNLVIHIKSFYVFMMKKLIYPNDEDLKKKLDHEIYFCNNYSHRCITPFYGFLKDDGKIIGFIYEFMSNGNLQDFVQSDINCKSYSLMTISRIAQGLEYLKSKSLIHRDLKPQNILIDNNFLPYISDFDTIKSIKDMDEISEMTDDYGSPFYISPEQASMNSISYPTDVYSFGLIIYFLFEKKHMKSSSDSIIPISNVSEKLQNLYKKCVQELSDNRPTIEEIKMNINEEIKYFCSIKTNFDDYIKTGDVLLFYENFLEQKNREELINSHCFENVFNFHYSLLSTESNTNPSYLQDVGVLYFYGKVVKKDYLMAKKFLELAFKQNKRYGSYLLGKMYFEGLGVEKSYLIAKEYLEISASFNDSDALDNLGLIYQYGFGVERDYLKAENYFKLAISNEYDMAYIHLGLLYENVNKDYNKARECYIESTSRGLVNGYFNLGNLYAEGLGVKQDYKKAREFYEKSAKCNNKDSLFQLGRFYQYGYGVDKNINKALKYYLEAANLDDPNAYINLGLIYFNGHEIESKDIKRAMHYYEKALELNCSFGAYFLAEIYEKGIDVKKDLKKAFQLYKLASKKSNSFALIKLGDFYERGFIVEQDYIKALQYFELAAKQNNSFAFVRIGDLFKYGHGVNQNIVKMFSYYLKGSEQNNPDSLFYLGEFYSNGEFYEPEIDKSIDYYLKCSKIVDYECLFVEIDECDSFEFCGVLHNSYKYPSLNNIGLIYITFLNDIEKAKEFIKEAGHNEYPFGQNNLGLLNQFYFNDIGNAEYFFTKASKYNFALADYNLGHFYEKCGKIEDAIKFYIKASENEDVPLYFQYKQIKDKQLEISKTFIICLTNLKLSEFYFKQENFEKSKFYFIKSFAKLNKKSSNCNHQFQFRLMNEDTKNQFTCLKEFILNCPLFNFGNQLSQNVKLFDLTTSNDEEKIDDLSIKNTSEKGIVDLPDGCNIKEKIVIDDPAHFFDFIIMNKRFHAFFIDEIKSIIDEMNKKLYEKPYSILFGRINIRVIKEKQNVNPINASNNVNHFFYEGIGFD